MHVLAIVVIVFSGRNRASSNASNDKTEHIRMSEATPPQVSETTPTHNN